MTDDQIPDIVHLDVSTLEPPQPMTEITKLLSALAEDGLLRVTHRRAPIPLFEIIREKFFYRHIEITEDDHVIFIWHRDDLDSAEYVRSRNNENGWS